MQAGSRLVPRRGTVYITSRTDGPCCGLKKHGTRSSGTGLPATRARTHASENRPVASVSITMLSSSIDPSRGAVHFARS